jgi:hypothetical protein
LLFGGKITSFSINFFDISAHAGIDGKFMLWQQALISVAGVSLPVLVCMVYLLLSAKRNDIILYYFKTIFFMVTVNTLLAWIFIPVLALMGTTVGDDSFNFLNYTHIPPLIQSGVAVLVYIFCWILFFRQMGGVNFLVTRFRTSPIDLASPQGRKTILSLAGVGVIVGASTLALTLSLPNHTFDVPTGYQQVAEIDLSKTGLTNQSIYSFTLDAPTSVNLYITLSNIQGAPVNIRLTGPAGYEKVYLNMIDPNTVIGQASVTPEAEVLEQGDYKILVSFPACLGQVKVYFQ